MTTTIVLPDLADLGLDFKPTCAECETEPAVLVLHQWCGDLHLVCKPCRDRLESTAHEFMPDTATCDECGASIYARRFADIFVRETPL